jgi:hypothetical protein
MLFNTKKAGPFFAFRLGPIFENLREEEKHPSSALALNILLGLVNCV